MLKGPVKGRRKCQISHRISRKEIGSFTFRASEKPEFGLENWFNYKKIVLIRARMEYLRRDFEIKLVQSTFFWT